MTQSTELSGPRYLSARIPAMANATTDLEVNLDALPGAAKIIGVKWIPDAAVTANGTNYTTLSVRNRGAAGAGSVLPASRSYAATNSSAFVAEDMTLSSTASDLVCAAGDVLTVQALHTASGVALPAGLVRVAYQLN